jgi:choline-sulfatase
VKPNILFIITDQQNATMLSCAGNEYLKTPGMDSIAAEGVRFERAYCTDPACVPSRFSMLTGRMPSAIGQRGNPSRHLPDIPEHIKQTAVGRLLRAAGYETVYGGKVHLPKRLSPEDMGFETIERDEREALAQTAADYLSREHDRPFCMVASFINPHDICYMGIRDYPASDFDRMLVERGETELANLDWALQRPPGLSDEEFRGTYCPPLPPNFEPQEDEPEALTEFVGRRPFRPKIREEWSEQRWRLHRWAYCRLTEKVDSHIGKVLDALRDGPYAGDTLVVFTSDHGDHDASHMLEHKTYPYEEAARIPLLVRPPGGSEPVVDREHLVSTGLDLLPTFCDCAGASVPGGLGGRSLRPLLMGGDGVPWRDHLLVEFEFGYAVVTDRYKYVLCDDGADREQLYDLREDPYETRNAAADPGNEDALMQQRRLLEQQLESRNAPTTPEAT